MIWPFSSAASQPVETTGTHCFRPRNSLAHNSSKTAELSFLHFLCGSNKQDITQFVHVRDADRHILEIARLVVSILYAKLS